MGRLDLPDKYRDEDTEPEIGSDAWISAEIAAGRSGEERDSNSGRGRAPAAARESVRLAAARGWVGGGTAVARKAAVVKGRVRALSSPSPLSDV